MSDEFQSFRDMGLAPPVLRAVETLGYDKPTGIQQQTITPLLAGSDVVGQAQTGTGKTAAFTLPLLSRLTPGSRGGPSLVVLTPTRELATQVAEAMQRYGQFMERLSVLPIYGGAGFGPQLRGLKQGTDVVVATPGRAMDHIRRGTLSLENVQGLVLDEADEMLKMGFIGDVEWILEQIPGERQIALFSATMPKEIRRIANRYLSEPVEVTVKQTTMTAETIRQRFVVCRPDRKIATLALLLDIQETEGVLVFVRTRRATVEVSAALEELGHESAALSGDLAQRQREEIVRRLKSGALNVIVATDVAARGLDVSRISHVINFDFPDEGETYVHRIGRTGRAGRAGEALTLLFPKELYRLRKLEQLTRQKIEAFEFPTRKALRKQRVLKLKEGIVALLSSDGIDEFEQVVEEVAVEQELTPVRIAAALVRELRAGEPLEPDYTPPPQTLPKDSKGGGGGRGYQGRGGPAKRPFKGKPKKGKGGPFRGKPTGGKPAGGKPTGGKPAGGKPAGGKPAGGKPTGGRPTSGKPAGGKPTGGKPRPPKRRIAGAAKPAKTKAR